MGLGGAGLLAAAKPRETSARFRGSDEDARRSGRRVEAEAVPKVIGPNDRHVADDGRKRPRGPIHDVEHTCRCTRNAKRAFLTSIGNMLLRAASHCVEHRRIVRRKRDRRRRQWPRDQSDDHENRQQIAYDVETLHVANMDQRSSDGKKAEALSCLSLKTGSSARGRG